MNQYSFDIKILEEKINFERESTFENFISQFQVFCSKVLCIKNGKYLYFYDKQEDVPKNIYFEYKKRRGEMTEYYFRDNTNSYCVFGRDSAKFFFPRIEEIDSPGITEKISIVDNIKKNDVIDSTDTSFFLTVLIDDDKEFIFHNPNYPLEIISK